MISLKIKVFWDVTPCRFANSYGRFERSCSYLNILQLIDPEDRDTTILPKYESN